MKLNGIVGKGTGRLGASVFAISGGEQIVRQYNPKVSNPNTDAQAEQRAKLKLMSQLAADLAQTIGFQKKGLVSARNQFISANIGKCTFENNKAQIDFDVLDLTGGKASLPNIVAQNTGNVELAASAPANVSAVLYALYKEGDDDQLQLVEQKIVSVAGQNNKFPTALTAPSGQACVFAYGIVNTGNASLVSYEDYVTNFSGNDASLSYIRSVVVKGGALTVTKYTSEFEE